MSGICDTCKRKECYMQHDGDDSCPLYIKGRPSNYKRLFGTPERAARTLSKAKGLCNWCDVESCAENGGECRIYDYDSLLEWLGAYAE